MDAFYEAVDDGVFASTELTRGPWDEGAQHAGPPAALLGYAIEHRADARPDMRVARIAYHIARPVPIAPLTVTTRVVRAGRSTEVVAADLAAGGKVLMSAEAVLIRAADGVAPAVTLPLTVPSPDDLEATLTPFRFAVGYHTAMETRYAIGSFTAPGPASVWFRMRFPLVAGEPIDPLSRVLTAADSGNGVSQVLDIRAHIFMNPDLTVHLVRYPTGEWVCLDAVTTIDPSGIGLADTQLSDVRGPIGRGSQSLYITPRH